MRILIAHHHRTLLGGIETYLAAVLPRLTSLGHKLMFGHEAAADDAYPVIELPAGAEAISLERGLEAAMTAIRDWKPDVAYVHALHLPEFQREIVEEYPTVLFAHGYYGLCISGSKTWQRSEARPCGKQFGLGCLFHFHARGCGGANPITMLRDYRTHARQLGTLKKCEAILTHGGQMQREYVAAGIRSDRVLALPHFVEKPMMAPRGHELAPTANVLFVGRFDNLKGGTVLLRALPMIAEKLKRPVKLTMAGAGPREGEWKRIAARVSSESVSVKFPGWLAREAKDRAMAESDLLIVPSVWPEPFGQVGLEAANLGVPAVAFDVGGISRWLREGVNGHLAAANPPTANGLAAAVAKALGNPQHYAKLRAGAERVAAEFTMEKHLDALNKVLERAARARG